jgi:acyl-CoA reductase-like NAD-dependent aldehyde dehydrogenase
MHYTTVNPATEEVLGHYETAAREEVERILAGCHTAYLAWREEPLAARTERLRALAAILRRRAHEHARCITLEMGKPVTEARAEIEKCAWLAEVCADQGAAWLAEEQVAADGREHRVVLEPLGVVLSIMPWNFPFWQALRFAVPALLAGNASLLKHASNVPQCAFSIETAFREAGFPADLFRTLLAGHETVAQLIADDRVRGVSLTGSAQAGARVAALAGQHLKPVVLELGGSDPFIVLDDADVELAAVNAVRGRMGNAGQSCIAAKRFILLPAVAEPFTRRFCERVAELRVGDPLDPATEVGPLVSGVARRELEDQLARSIAMGARVLIGGTRLPRPGFYFAPTVVADVTPEMPIMREETFGPVAPILVVADDEAAIRAANATEFGLGASIWTRDVARGERMVRRIEAGTVFVNSIVKSDPRMPFGGVKRSGLGRELSQHGVREFVNIKGINVYPSA